MTVSATQAASPAATAASAALPPSVRISTPAAAVAGWPAATPALTIRPPARRCGHAPRALLPRARAPYSCGVRYPDADPASARSAPSLARRAGARETRTRRHDGSHQGSQAGTDQQARPQRVRYGLARGADRDAHAAHQRADGASAHAPARPLLTPRALEARRAAAALSDLPAEAQSRGLPRPDQGARLAPLAPGYTQGGRRFE